jgi:hypothetical protein
MKGYWNRPDETAKVMTPDGAFRTGDIGLMTPEGFVKIVDRKKDMISVSGIQGVPQRGRGRDRHASRRCRGVRGGRPRTSAPARSCAW